MENKIQHKFINIQHRNAHDTRNQRIYFSTYISGIQALIFKIKYLRKLKNYPHIQLHECISRVWRTLLHKHTNDTHTLLVPYHKQYMAVLAPSLVCIMGTRCSLMDSIISYNNQKYLSSLRLQWNKEIIKTVKIYNTSLKS